MLKSEVLDLLPVGFVVGGAGDVVGDRALFSTSQAHLLVTWPWHAGDWVMTGKEKHQWAEAER